MLQFIMYSYSTCINVHVMYMYCTCTCSYKLYYICIPRRVYTHTVCMYVQYVHDYAQYLGTFVPDSRSRTVSALAIILLFYIIYCTTVCVYVHDYSMHQYLGTFVPDRRSRTVSALAIIVSVVVCTGSTCACFLNIRTNQKLSTTIWR